MERIRSLHVPLLLYVIIGLLLLIAYQQFVILNQTTYSYVMDTQQNAWRIDNASGIGCLNRGEGNITVNETVQRNFTPCLHGENISGGLISD